MKQFRVNVWFVCCAVYMIFFMTKDNVLGQDIKTPSLEFRRHHVVTPTVHHSRTKRELTHTKDDDGLHHPELTLTVAIDGQEYVLDLVLKKDLITKDHVIRYQKNGETVVHKPSKEELDICQYSGKVRGKTDSWAAVSTCKGVRGVIYDGDNMRYIEPTDNSIDSDHYVYDHTDLKTEKHCGYKGGVTNNTNFDPELLKSYLKEKEIRKSRPSRYKRNTKEVLVRGPFNSDRRSRYVELVLVVDHDEFLINGADIRTAHAVMKDVANIINEVYTPLNIFIALVGVVVWTERDEIVLLENGDTTLTNFLAYRRQVLIPNMPNDNAQLLTRKKFHEGVVGKALKGPICTYESSGGVSTNHSDVLGLVAATIAHEMGHNFGMEHDTEEDCKCPDEKCIMSPTSTSVMPTHWSSCSLKSLALAFERGMDYCLRNKPESLYASPTCGNGFVEVGEQCDCGSVTSPRHTQCVACCSDCMLRTNASCATGHCCDFQTCRPKPAGTECRESNRECDLPEYCSGHSEYCPEDVHRMDSTPCGDDQAYCVRGSCRSHTDQCRLLWGTTGEMSHPTCYSSMNSKGTVHGNCGYDIQKKVFKPCKQEDTKCGLLHCKHLNEQLEFGLEHVATLAHSFVNVNGTIAPCRTALIDLGLSQVDPGLVPDGAKCGDNKMCMGQKCVPVDYIRRKISKKDTSVCPSDCSGHGVCNSEGHCHCDVGFAPPLCDLPGAGGSLDSGPATDLSVQRNFMMAMYIIFLGIIPLILIILFILHYSKHNDLRWWKPKKSVQSPKKTSLQSRISKSASKFASNFQNSHGQANQQAVNVHTLSSPDDMSSSLLRNDSDRSPAGNMNPTVNFFGNFKGFSLTPMEQETKNKPEPVIKTKPDVNKSAKITPVHRNSSNAQTVSQGILKPVLRAAPPLPIVPAAAKTSPKTSPSIKRANSSVQNRIKALMNNEKIEENSPVNPPPRPVISSPILEASTCTAKELISPLQGSKTLGPIRTAPRLPNDSPGLPQRPLSMHSSNDVPQKPLPEEPKKVKEGISLNRIASFLKHEKPKERQPVERSHSLPKNSNNQVKIQKAIDKVALRNLQISNPILQKNIDLPVNTVPVVSDSEDSEDPKSFVNRTQSMRGSSVTQKPIIHSFGSMRQAPGVSRPVSVVGRPTAPPPPLPNDTKGPTHYQQPKLQTEIKSTDYVDCIEEKQAPLAHIDEESDNIYAIIEESPEKPFKPLPQKNIQPQGEYKTPKPITSNSGSTESLGLLGEIVNEIQNRNLDSIYSTSTMARRKKEREQNEAGNNRDSTYMNSDYKTPESVYSNSGGKSNSSTTSNGYLNPASVNVPTFLNKNNPTQDETIDKTTVTKIPTFTRQITPPVLKNTSSFRNVPQSPKNTPKNLTQKPATVNSPDLVSSCAVPEPKNTKPPDVINNNKIVEVPKVAVKPNLRTNDNRPPVKPTQKITPITKPTSVGNNINKIDKNTTNRINSKVDSNVKSIADNLNKNKPKIVPKPSTITVQRTDSNIKPSANKLPAKPSSVASLQQKFENRKSFGRETTTAKK